ncbi:MAG: TatD family hydrolase [Thermoplasmata archaeon]|nr:TatD family hydrolase [Thermoplasmata archaeon]MCI4353766.1 TatD family hydrolase [Thermoplasmata archaeon]
MALPADLPIVDHHLHLSPNGEGVGAARRFAAAGGTHLFLATQNYAESVPLRLEEYRAQFETTERLARQIESETRVRVYPVVAPYPIDLLHQIEKLGRVAATELQCAALDLAGSWVESQRAVALGEVGRPHFAILPEIVESVDGVFRHALEVARDAGCPAVVHCGDLDLPGYRELASFAASAAFPLHRLVKHYARTVVPSELRLGIVPSYIARKELMDAVRQDRGPWFLETDFLDDPARKGAVLDITTVPKRARAIAAAGPEGLELLRGPFIDSVRTVYGLDSLEEPRAPG